MALTNPTPPRPFVTPPTHVLTVALKASLLLGLIKKWSHDGALQTFEDRERFRAEAREAIAAVEAQS